VSTRPDSATGGAAQELPAGRLRSFEDDDAAPDLASLLSRRAPRQPAETEPVDAPAAAKQPAARRRPTAPPVAAPATSVPPVKRRGSASSTEPARAPRARPKAPQAQQPPPEAAEAGQQGRQNRIRSSSVHIPAALLDRVIAERDRTSRSNGELIIAAIEQTHSELPALIGRRESTGGGLFASRSSRGARLSDGPLTPLNVRLFEADYRVIDDLVTQFGAYSRGHLISTALTAYFDALPPVTSTEDR